MALTFDENLKFSNGFTAEDGLAPYDWYEGMFDDGEQVDENGNLYDKMELEKAVFKNEDIHVVKVVWFRSMHGNKTNTSFDFSFEIQFEEKSPTFKELLDAVHKEFSKPIRLCEAMMLASQNPWLFEYEKGENHHKTPFSERVKSYEGRPRYYAWHPEEIPFLGPLVKTRNHYYELGTYR